jgi:IS1 family transposase
MGKLLLTIGLVGLCHAAYSATQHRNYLRLIESEFTALPNDILLQTLLSLLSCCFGVIGISTKFKPIQITSEWENKTWDNIANRTSFYSFNHRGKYLFSDDFDSNDAASLAADSAFFKSTLPTHQLTEKQKKERQNALIRQRLAEAHRDDQSSSSLSTSEEDGQDISTGEEQEEDQ